MGDCANLCVSISAENATVGGWLVFGGLFVLPWLLGLWVIVCEITDVVFRRHQ